MCFTLFIITYPTFLQFISKFIRYPKPNTQWSSKIHVHYQPQDFCPGRLRKGNLTEISAEVRTWFLQIHTVFPILKSRVFNHRKATAIILFSIPLNKEISLISSFVQWNRIRQYLFVYCLLNLFTYAKDKIKASLHI